MSFPVLPSLPRVPTVTVCCPTFNRRPFIPMMLQCYQHQTYPKDKMNLLIVDDGTDPIGDLVVHLPYVTYVRIEEKLTLGQKRNLMNERATGQVLVYHDDDDYYFPERVAHAVDTLRKHRHVYCVGSSEMYMYFKHIHKMYVFGPYGPCHATAASFAFRRELLRLTRFSDDASLAEERYFLHNYTVPFAQLDKRKTIVVFSHAHNSFNKQDLLTQPSTHRHDTHETPERLVKQPALYQFFMHDIDTLLSHYASGTLDHKPDVQQQLVRMREQREQRMMAEQQQYQTLIASSAWQQEKRTLEDKIALLETKLIQTEEKVAHYEKRFREVLARTMKQPVAL